MSTQADKSAQHSTRQNALEELRRSEKRFRALIENSYDTIVLNNQEGCIIYCSPSIKIMLGYEPEELQGLNGRNVVHPDDIPQVREKFIALSQMDGCRITVEYRMRHKDGSWHWVEGIWQNLLANPDVSAFVINIHDITDRKKAEEALHLQATVLGNISDAVFSTDATSYITSWNKAAEELYGWQEQEVLGKNASEVNPPTLVDATLGDVLQELRETGRWSGEVTQQRKDGTTLAVRASTNALKNAAGEVVGYVTVNRDISEWKRVREERNRLLTRAQEARQAAEKLSRQLEKEREWLRLAQKAGHIGTFEWFIREEKLVWTPELEALYGLPSGSFEGKYENWARRIHPDDYERAEDNLQKAITQGVPYEVEFRVIWPDGSTHWLLAQGEVYNGPDNKPERLVGVNIDITERKNLEQRKDEFIGMASHELKTPLTSLKGFLYLLQHNLNHSQVDQRQARDYLARMDRQVNRLTRLINDLLDISRIQTGKIVYRKEFFDLDALIQEVLENVQAMTPSHLLLYEQHVQAQVYGDKDRIGQVLINLLTNAVKYSPGADAVLLRVTRDEQRVTVSVQDFGIGIDIEHHDKIFERFYQISSPKEKPFSGLGIGLYLSSEIIQRHGGQMQLQSEKGAGSTFSFTLPLAETA
ncbi:MAG TPA: PAS domain S-box protein [Ktedonobacteraceae bacterium]|nr:PAS domain S-box protein [Ktedonobacteraceae bacterium]